MITSLENTISDQAGVNLPPDLLLVILGPTAAGKTDLAVRLAQALNGEIISVDSRQLYRGMDIGTGKDLASYQQVPYHLIDICEPGEKYNVSRFLKDFQGAYKHILANNKQPIACGGTGMYLHALLQEQPYINVPVNNVLRGTLALNSKEELVDRLLSFSVPKDFKIDHSSHKRLIRAIEILTYLQTDPQTVYKEPHIKYPHKIFGLDPALALRRQRITDRLQQRIQEGLLEEIQALLKNGISHAELQYYGLEYKYASLYLLGELDMQAFQAKLETEIHRYAKRQMTFYRKMEKDGIAIHWLKNSCVEEQLAEIWMEIKKG